MDTKIFLLGFIVGVVVTAACMNYVMRKYVKGLRDVIKEDTERMNRLYPKP